MSIITLLTDFGTADGYVAAMKGAIRTIAPDVFIDDASHDIAPGDVHAAAWALGAYCLRYPQGTVHLIVVDPGVGSARRAIALASRGQFFVAPDNGLVTHVISAAGDAHLVAIEIDVPQHAISNTFHGRDIFAPAAARLAAGVPLTELGRVIDDVTLLQLARPVREDHMIRGEVMHVDGYGNLITNIPAAWLPDDAAIRICDRDVPFARTYIDVAPGALLALIGSRDVLEISVRDGSAAEMLRVGRGSEVVVG